MRVFTFSLAVATSLAAATAAQADAGGDQQSPPLEPRTAESGLPLSAAQEATGLPYLDLQLKVDPDSKVISGDARYTLRALAPLDRSKSILILVSQSRLQR